jgi:pSer/pThr/pTyr-binding forkhead associated (FHA) protein
MAELILEIVEGRESGRQIALAAALEIGRDPSVTLALEDDEVSRRHVRISQQGGQAVVEDLGSTNGTFVNEQPIEGPRTLQPGDRIRTGLTVLQLRTGEQVARQPSAVLPVPQVTRLRDEVLEPARQDELAAAPPPQVAAGEAPQVAAGEAPRFRPEESEPAFVPPEVAEDAQARADYKAVARLVDARVKSRTNLAVFALLGAAALAVVLAFGLK